MTLRLTCLLVLMLSLAACQRPGQNVYGSNEVGRTATVSFGTLLAVREVAIKGDASGVGGTVGAVAGGVAGSQFGRGSGNVAAALAGVLVGALVGAMAEQAIEDRAGLEYTLTLENGQSLVVVQDRGSNDRILEPGERVMLQTTGRTQRVLPADDLPTAVRRPQGITVTN